MAYMFAAPLFGPMFVSRQPMRVQERGMSATTKPTKPLKALSMDFSGAIEHARHLQGCRVAECATKVSLDSCLGIEIQLLEHFRRDGQQTGTPNSFEDGLMGFFAAQTVVVFFEFGHVGYQTV